MGMKKLAQGSVATSAGSAEYTVPTGYSATVKDICISNTTTATIACSLHLVPSGGSADTTNALMYSTTIPANGLFQWTGEQYLTSGDFIQVVGASAGLVMNITGEENRD